MSLVKDVNTQIYGRGPWQEAWLVFSKSKTALAGLVVFILLIFVAIFAERIAPFGFDDQNLRARFIPPGRDFFFGTDNLGRCIFSRVIWGSRYSLAIGAVVMSISAVAGVILGAIAGFFSDFLDNVLMRVVDILMAIPNMLFAITVIAVLGPGIENVILAIGIMAIPGYARMIRATVLAIKDQEFIEAATCIGASRVRILFTHVLPNCIAPIIVQMSLNFSTAILVAAGLSFIGLGILPPLPEWGAMLNNARPFIRQHPHMITFPGLAIMTIILSLSLIGDGLRDALDPRLKK